MLKIGNRISSGQVRQMYIEMKLGTLPRRRMHNSAPRNIEPMQIDSAISEAPIRQVFNVDIIMPNFSFAPIYRVILRYNNWTDDREVAKTVKQAVPVISYSAAKQTVANAKAYGHGIVITAAQEDATKYTKNLVSKGLDADMIEA